mmetsp:Transcript_17307/g.49181  ORF Transcript_17307/g.49181 Transcript_17307/m.49181 type:complete len:282 (-) Transcript_17307:529-1374(-)
MGRPVALPFSTSWPKTTPSAVRRPSSPAASTTSGASAWSPSPPWPWSTRRGPSTCTWTPLARGTTQPSPSMRGPTSVSPSPSPRPWTPLRCASKSTARLWSPRSGRTAIAACCFSSLRRRRTRTPAPSSARVCTTCRCSMREPPAMLRAGCSCPTTSVCASAPPRTPSWAGRCRSTMTSSSSMRTARSSSSTQPLAPSISVCARLAIRLVGTELAHGGRWPARNARASSASGRAYQSLYSTMWTVPPRTWSPLAALPPGRHAPRRTTGPRSARSACCSAGT